MIIAIDGPAGAGKSTVCKILAQKLRFLYLDTGAMFRAVAWALLQEKADCAPGELSACLRGLALRFRVQEGRLAISHRGAELADELRNPEISDEASRISRMEPVREFLLVWQKKLAEQGDIVAEGRDTATVVFPDADLKVFLTASPETRINRRLAEYRAKGIDIEFREMERQIRERDEADSRRDLAPMRPADGAIILDTSALDVEQVVERLVREARSRMKPGNAVCGEL